MRKLIQWSELITLVTEKLADADCTTLTSVAETLGIEVGYEEDSMFSLGAEKQFTFKELSPKAQKRACRDYFDRAREKFMESYGSEKSALDTIQHEILGNDEENDPVAVAKYTESGEYIPKFEVEDDVTVSDPRPDDLWTHSFVGTIKTIGEHITVEDQDGDCWDVDFNQIKPS